MKRPELTNLSTKACRLLRPTVLTGVLSGALVLGGGLAWAQTGFQTGGSVIGDEVCIRLAAAAQYPWGVRPACARSASAWAGTAI